MPLTIVTGGSRGIGAAICRRLASDGHDVIVGYRSDAAAAAAIVADCTELGRVAIAVQVDTSDESSVEQLFESASELGTVSGLVNNAGISGVNGSLVDASAEGMRRALEVNVLGYLLCAKHAIRAFEGRGGAIVNISSAAATLGGPGQYVHYAATKAATDAMTIGLAKEVGALGIRVNAVAPGTIWTEFHEDPNRPAEVAKTVPLGRAGEPEEIANAVAWLLSGEASYANGAVIRVAGGL